MKASGWVLLGASLCAAHACGFDVQEYDYHRRRDAGARAEPAESPAEREPAQDRQANGTWQRALSAVTWNLEWFQDPERGPADDARQFEGARSALSRLDASVMGLQEISDPARFDELLAALPDYAAVISAFEWPQQLALLYRRAEFTVQGIASIEGLRDAGRPPLVVDLRARADGAQLRVVVVHAKAGGRDSDWQTRADFARGLHEQLAGRSAAAALIVLGDLNDRLGASILKERPSPYAVFVDDPHYATPTAALEQGREASTAWGETIDHVLIGAELLPLVRPDSADVLRDELVSQLPDLLKTVSDHAPVKLSLRPVD